MRVLLCLCVFISVTSAGFIGHPFTYYGSYPSLLSHPVTTYAISKPFGAYPGFHPLALGPSYYYSYNVLPGNFLYSSFPGIVTYFPAVPVDDKKKKDKKKPGDKKDEKTDEMKEETTEKPTKEEESKGEEADLSE